MPVLKSVRLRRLFKEQVARRGLGPFNRHVKTLDAYLQFGEWLKRHECTTTFTSRFEFYDYINTTCLSNSPVDYLEFGVYKGDSIAYWAKINANADSRFFGFDSFEGLPEDWADFSRTAPKGTFDTGGMIPAVDDPRVEFIKGYFQDTLHSFLSTFTPRNRLVLHLDADLYSSTLFVMTTMNWIIPKGAILIFDEFNSVTHEFRALVDYASSYRREYKTLGACEPFFTQLALEITA
jgi:O-methyltransferase